MRITRRIVFHAGHMLKDDTSKCHHPHGHEYVCDCTIEGQVQSQGEETGMVMNFGVLKQIMVEEIEHRFDHKFIIDSGDPRFDAFTKAINGEGYVRVDYAPTAENLAQFIHSRITGRLPLGIKVTNFRLQETLNCWAECQ